MHITTYRQQLLSCYAFIGFVADFRLKHPDHFLVPLRLNQSHLESILGQAHGMSGGNVQLNIGTYQCAVAQIAEKEDEKLTPVSMKRVAEGMVPVEQKKCSRRRKKRV